MRTVRHFKIIFLILFYIGRKIPFRLFLFLSFYLCSFRIVRKRIPLGIHDSKNVWTESHSKTRQSESRNSDRNRKIFMIGAQIIFILNIFLYI